MTMLKRTTDKERMALEDSNVLGNSKNESISGTCEGYDSIGERSVSEND